MLLLSYFETSWLAASSLMLAITSRHYLSRMAKEIQRNT